MTLRTAYSPRQRHVTATGNGKTVQYFKDEVNINNILKKYEAGQGDSVLINRTQPSYMDCTEVGDYRVYLDKVKRAQDAFSALPADVRLYFKNDPAQFVDFATKAENLEQMRKLGLAPELKEAAPNLTDDGLNTTDGTS